MFNLTFSWILLYIIVGVACSMFIELESPMWKVILYYIVVTLFWPIVILVFIIALLIYLFKLTLK